MPAKSMHSYSDTLYAVLDEFKPQYAFEWGPGTSTQILAMHPAVKSVKSVESDEFFYDLVEKTSFQNVTYCLKGDMNEYTSEIGDNNYDLIFIDGRDRVGCLKESFGKSDIVILHDAAREQYREAIGIYKHAVWTDKGNTVVLTNNNDVAERLKTCLSKLSCPEPELEHITIMASAEQKGMKL